MESWEIRSAYRFSTIAAVAGGALGAWQGYVQGGLGGALLVGAIASIGACVLVATVVVFLTRYLLHIVVAMVLLVFAALVFWLWGLRA
jgi:hypothetical protein